MNLENVQKSSALKDRPTALLAKPANPFEYVHDLSAPLLRLSRRDVWRVRDALEGGTQIFGSPGSGKSSGSARTIAHAMLRAGWGFLVLCARTEEADTWRRYCRETGREKSLVVFDGSGTHKFNFLTYALATQPGNLTQNIVDLLTHLLDASEGRFGPEGSDPFWKRSSGIMLGHAIDLLWHAYGRVTLAELLRLLNSRPKTVEETRSPHFSKSSFWGQTLACLVEDDGSPPPAHPLSADALQLILEYFFNELATPGYEKTVASIYATLSGQLGRLLKGKMNELFCTETTVVPEMTHEGAVLVIDLPAVTWHDNGVFAAHIWKHLWQRATLARPITPTTRPVVCWADECQFFLASHDGLFVSNSRAQRGCTVYISQNLPTYYSRIAARSPSDAADSLIGNFSTKLFHNNTDQRTNNFAAELIGRTVQWRYSESGSTNYGRQRGENIGGSSGSSSTSGKSGSSSGSNKGWTWGKNIGENAGTQSGWVAQETVDFELPPPYFATLAKGGREYGGKVEAVLHRGGKPFRHTGRNWILLSFRQ